jgi:hypothetical protein
LRPGVIFLINFEIDLCVSNGLAIAKIIDA